MYIWMFFILTYNNIQVILIWIKFLNLFFTELILKYSDVGFVGFSIRRFSNSWEKSWEYERWILLIQFPIICYVRSFPIVLYVHSLYCLSFPMFWVWVPSPITPRLSPLFILQCKAVLYVFFSFFYFKPFATPLFIQLFCFNIFAFSVLFFF